MAGKEIVVWYGLAILCTSLSRSVLYTWCSWFSNRRRGHCIFLNLWPSNTAAAWSLLQLVANCCWLWLYVVRLGQSVSLSLFSKLNFCLYFNRHRSVQLWTVYRQDAIAAAKKTFNTNLKETLVLSPTIPILCAEIVSFVILHLLRRQLILIVARV